MEDRLDVLFQLHLTAVKGLFLLIVLLTLLHVWLHSNLVLSVYF